MDDREAEETRAELVSRTFALMTAKCEDAATLAAECQGHHSNQMIRENSERLRDLISEADTIIDCVMALLCRAEG